MRIQSQQKSSGGLCKVYHYLCHPVPFTRLKQSTITKSCNKDHLTIVDSFSVQYILTKDQKGKSPIKCIQRCSGQVLQRKQEKPLQLSNYQVTMIIHITFEPKRAKLLISTSLPYAPAREEGYSQSQSNILFQDFSMSRTLKPRKKHFQLLNIMNFT